MNNKDMTKQEKIACLSSAMVVKKRADETEFTCFSDTAPEELKDLFLEHFEVRDLDYQTFSRACDVMDEIYSEDIKDIEDAIYDRANDSASVYTADRLSYINEWNQDEITDHVREINVDIQTAAAIWYDKQVENACFLIKNWVEL